MNSKTSLILAAGTAAALSIASLPTQAYEAGDMVLRAGLASVMPASDNGDAVSVDDALGLGISFSYMLSPTLGLEVLGASPFTHDIKPAGGGSKIAEATHLPPTVLLNYHFAPVGAFSGYAGLGINHTIFFDEKFVSGGNSLDLDASTGLAFQVGGDYLLNEHWAINAAAWYIDINTEATVTPSNGSASKLDVEIDPWVLMLGGAYRF